MGQSNFLANLFIFLLIFPWWYSLRNISMFYLEFLPFLDPSDKLLVNILALWCNSVLYRLSLKEFGHNCEVCRVQSWLWSLALKLEIVMMLKFVLFCLFQNSPLYQYLQDLGHTDFEICSSLSSKPEKCPVTEGQQKPPLRALPKVRKHARSPRLDLLFFTLRQNKNKKVLHVLSNTGETRLFIHQ